TDTGVGGSQIYTYYFSHVILLNFLYTANQPPVWTTDMMIFTLVMPATIDRLKKHSPFMLL
ncbi:MAG: hypothetical protein J7J70_08110, partial [Deltaproteobacteria bacterium]|nr:hypothetical protein [Candidatus Tharpellaceae bacterium]